MTSQQPLQVSLGYAGISPVPQRSKKALNLVSLRLKLRFGTLIVATTEVMNPGGSPRIFEGVRDRKLVAIVASPNHVLLSLPGLMESGIISFCRSVSRFATSSAVADATSQAGLGASAARNGRHGGHDRSNRRQNRSSA